MVSPAVVLPASIAKPAPATLTATTAVEARPSILASGPSRTRLATGAAVSSPNRLRLGNELTAVASTEVSSQPLSPRRIFQGSLPLSGSGSLASAIPGTTGSDPVAEPKYPEETPTSAGMAIEVASVDVGEHSQVWDCGSITTHVGDNIVLTLPPGESLELTGPPTNLLPSAGTMPDPNLGDQERDQRVRPSPQEDTQIWDCGSVTKRIGDTIVLMLPAGESTVSREEKSLAIESCAADMAQDEYEAESPVKARECRLKWECGQVTTHVGVTTMLTTPPGTPLDTVDPADMAASTAAPSSAAASSVGDDEDIDLETTDEAESRSSTSETITKWECGAITTRIGDSIVLTLPEL